jgi:Mce-associated membrane protein
MPTPRPAAEAAAPAGEANAARAPKAVAVQKEKAPAPRPRLVSGEAAELQRRLDRLRWVPAIVLAAVVLAVAGIGVWQSHGVWWGKRIGDTRTAQQQQVLATAKSCAVTILSYDYRKLPANKAAGEACMTGEFKTQFDQTYAQVVQPVATQKKAVQNLQLANGGVQSVNKDGSQWTVLLYGQLAYSDTTTPAGSPRLDIATFVATVTRTGGKWLISSLNPTG